MTSPKILFSMNDEGNHFILEVIAQSGHELKSGEVIAALLSNAVMYAKASDIAGDEIEDLFYEAKDAVEALWNAPDRKLSVVEDGGDEGET